jgi:hypothetical protein
MIDYATFVNSILAAMWMLNDLPKPMRKDLEAQLGLIWVLLSDRKCFPSLTFSPEQQRGICLALAAASGDTLQDFKFTYEALQQLPDLKVDMTPDDNVD